ncbi:MAG: Asp-tRNA(Asn)/Glu-tRNA(Gln) amidotransferase subunit GatA [Clostridia bacterium]|nr:Asp-tRNA(Asn)/Glu-tRNA(Gln) amidotransferase subunit GatA [Clostridia bacterium]
MDYTQLSILEVAKLLREGKVTSLELTKQALQMAKEKESFNALTQVFEEDALKQAALVDEMFKSGKELPLLAGVPITIKDNINLTGKKTTCSSKFLSTYVSPYDATIVKNLKSSYAIIIGKNNMDEFAMGSTTENSAFGPTLNPRNPQYIPGGSSGGSAAAVAANIGYASVGTDTGGSVRQPSAMCGVVGLKPTYGLVSRYGIVAFASSLDQAGPVTKTVKDSALMLNVLSCHDEMEETSVKRDKIDYMQSFTGSVKGIKIALIKECFGDGLDEEVKQKIMDAKSFYESQGAEIIELSIPVFNDILACYYILSSAEAASNLSRFDGVKYGFSIENPKNLNDLYLQNRSKGFGKEVKRRIMLGNYVLSSGYYDAYYKKAKKVQKKLVKQFAEVFKLCDVILMPTAPTPAFKIGEKVGDPLSMYLSDIYTVPVNIAELPAISVPCGVSKNGLPIGMQLIGSKFSETTLFNVADVFETQKEAK